MEKFAFIHFLWSIFLLGYLSAEKSSEEEIGYIFTCPKSLQTGATNELLFRRYYNFQAGTLKVAVTYDDPYTGNISSAKEELYDIEEGKAESILPLYLEPFDNYVYTGKITINGTFGDNQIGGTDRVYFSNSKDNIIIIQTDKPLYKEGQPVKFRVLAMNKTLTPLQGVNANISVEDPSGTRISQWKGVSLEGGMKQFEFQLTDEPVKGEWRIIAEIKKETSIARFQVKEYVLPTYDLKIEQPPFVLANAEEIPIKICAKYTYGKAVKGNLNMNISTEAYAWSNEKLPTLKYEGKIDGCFKYVMNVSQFEDENYYTYRRIQIVASVEEEATGVKRNQTEYIQRHYLPLFLNFHHEQAQYFKPGLPYNGKLFVKNPDNSPAEGESMQLCSTITKERTVMGGKWKATRTVKFCQNYTSNDEGIVEFVIPRQNIDSVSISVEAKSIKYADIYTKITSQRQGSLNLPQTSMWLTPWYSPSGSFIQLQPVQETLLCGTKKSLKALFTSKTDGDFTFYYEVFSRGRIIQKGQIEKSFKVSDDVAKQYEDEGKVIDDVELQIVPSIDRNPSTDSSYSSSSDSSSASSDSSSADSSSSFSDSSSADSSSSFSDSSSADSSSSFSDSSSSDSSSSESKENECQSEKEARYVPPVGDFDIEVDIEPALSRTIQVMVYYIRDEGREVVADSQIFNVEKCFKNQVKLQFGDQVKQPGTKTSIRVTASPNSLCGIKVVDKSVSLLNSDDQVTPDSIFSLIENFDTYYYYYSGDLCNKKVPQPGLCTSPSISPRPPGSWSYSYSTQGDSVSAFQKAGFLIISNLKIFNRICTTTGGGGNIVYAQDNYGGNGGAVHSKVDYAYTTRRPEGQLPPRYPAPPHVVHNFGNAETKSAVNVRNYFPETWLFKLESTGDDGTYVTKETLPHTVTEWTGSAICINEDGLGLSNIAGIKGFQAFFISLTLPYSVIRGEMFWFTVSIFNYVEDAMPIKVTLDNMEGFEVMSESINGEVCVEPGTSKNLKVQVKGVALGPMNITVRAETAQSSDACGSASISDALAKDAITKSVIVEPEGWAAEEIKSVLFCPQEEENGVFKTTFPLREPNDVVPDSSRAYLDVTGDPIGKSMKNLENLVSIPTGCGEQNMVKLVPNVLVMDLLQGTNQLTDKMKARIKENLSAGVQRELNYKRHDGSYSAFGTRDKEGSTFLTAFVLRYFSYAAEFISIDQKILTMAQKWLASKQQSNGCFLDIGKIFDRGLQGSMEKEKSQGTITAYVTIALLKSNYENEAVVEDALSCISNSEDTSLYATFLFSYAEALAGKTESAIERIQSANERVTTKGNVKYYQDVNATKSQIVETAGYAILANLKTTGSAKPVLPIIKFLTQDMNELGGFHSTQDTCVGLEALAEFAKLTFKDDVDITVKATRALEKTFEIKEDEKLIVKRYKADVVRLEIDVEATGSGCAVLQAVMKYNTKTPPEKRSFNLEVAVECLDDECKRGRISISCSYIPEGKSNMALAEIKMITGMAPVKESLEKLLNDNTSKVKRYDIEDNRVIFYFSGITNEEESFSFEVEKDFKVENCQPGTVTLTDYYDRDKSSSTSYSFEN